MAHLRAHRLPLTSYMTLGKSFSNTLTLYVSFPICKTEIVRVPTLRFAVNSKGVKTHEVSGAEPGTKEVVRGVSCPFIALLPLWGSVSVAHSPCQPAVLFSPSRPAEESSASPPETVSGWGLGKLPGPQPWVWPRLPQPLLLPIASNCESPRHTPPSKKSHTVSIDGLMEFRQRENLSKQNTD